MEIKFQVSLQTTKHQNKKTSEKEMYQILPSVGAIHMQSYSVM